MYPETPSEAWCYPSDGPAWRVWECHTQTYLTCAEGGWVMFWEQVAFAVGSFIGIVDIPVK